MYSMGWLKSSASFAPGILQCRPDIMNGRSTFEKVYPSVIPTMFDHFVAFIVFNSNLKVLFPEDDTGHDSRVN